MRAADRHDDDPFRVQITAEAGRCRFQGDLVADALDEHHGQGGLGLRQGASRRQERGGVAAQTTIERFAGKLARARHGAMIGVRERIDK
ncbi:hypothetical protein Pa4123_74460 [Phytohabitans aurantiacus]|uniref:Uncharacterized protein n=1 Tax=Phytohabitans aurantiacus TaxID=3016789 RepID=A0ABQ5R6G7_9ACTN|nr:hypothetical protein Pa4123_74460 [Phytohabitans aurantiacus]